MNDFETTLVVIGFLLLAAVSVYLRLPSVKGQAGEARVNNSLRRHLDENDYVILNDLTLPYENGTTQIDHIILSRFGVFVVETKNMSGWIFGSERQARWTQTLPKHKSQFQNPLRQNYLHVKVVQDLLGLDQKQIFNVIAFVGSAEPRTDMPENVNWSTRQLATYVRSKRKSLFSGNEVKAFSSKLRARALEASRENQRAHVRYVKEKPQKKQIDPTRCPRCGSNMVKRTNRKTQQDFLGCSRFPQCKSTQAAK